MWQIGVWEREEGLADHIAALCRGLALVRCGRHPAQLTGRRYDLLVVSPRAVGWAGAAALSCRAALLPGGLSALTRPLSTSLSVSYGMGSANTLTLSSLDGARAAVAIQREFPTLDGCPVERQELILPYRGPTPELFLARVGTGLLLGMERGE